MMLRMVHLSQELLFHLGKVRDLILPLTGPASGSITSICTFLESAECSAILDSSVVGNVVVLEVDEVSSGFPEASTPVSYAITGT